MIGVRLRSLDALGLAGALDLAKNEARQQAAVLSSYWRKPKPGAALTLEVDPDDDCITRVLESGQSWESWLTPYLKRYCDPGKVSLDIGANIGTHTVTLAGLSLQVHAFEPQRRVFEILARNAASFGNVTAHNVAADNAPGIARMKAPTKNVGATEIARDGTGETVTCVRIDDLDFAAPIGFIKIDVEKHELEALAGALETVRRDRPVIIMEDQVHARDLLQPLGYRCRRIAIVDFLCLPM